MTGNNYNCGQEAVAPNFNTFPRVKVDETLSLLNMEEIARARKEFYKALMGKKRKIRRTYLQMGVVSNEEVLDSLSYRALLQPPHFLLADEEIEQGPCNSNSNPQSEELSAGDFSDCDTTFPVPVLKEVVCDAEKVILCTSPDNDDLENDDNQVVRFNMEEGRVSFCIDDIESTETDLEIQRILGSG